MRRSSIAPKWAESPAPLASVEAQQVDTPNVDDVDDPKAAERCTNRGSLRGGRQLQAWMPTACGCGGCAPLALFGISFCMCTSACCYFHMNDILSAEDRRADDRERLLEQQRAVDQRNVDGSGEEEVASAREVLGSSPSRADLEPSCRGPGGCGGGGGSDGGGGGSGRASPVAAEIDRRPHSGYEDSYEDDTLSTSASSESTVNYDDEADYDPYLPPQHTPAGVQDHAARGSGGRPDKQLGGRSGNEDKEGQQHHLLMSVQQA